MKRTTREWVRKAEADYLAARQLARASRRFHDQTCFLFQQSAEKYLKALLEELGLAIPHTHVLKDLLALLRLHHPMLSPFRRGLTFLTRFAVGTRYPGDNATKRQARAAQRWARKIREKARVLLGLPVHPKRQRKKPP
jgi:HEPN domain-containing protein